MRRAVRIGTLVVAVTFSVSGCGGEGDTSAESTSDASSSRCEPLPSAAVEHLGSALSGGATLGGPVAVRSDDFEHIYFVAAEVDGEPALWTMNRLEGFGLIYSVNEHAYSVSGMGRSSGLRDPITEDDDGASEALSCVRSP